MVTIIDLLSTTYAPVQMTMLTYLDVADIVALSCTSKGFDQLQSILKATAYNINRHLKKFFDDPLKFRSILGRCGGIIVGKFARRFFLRSDVHTRSLMIYLEGEGKKCLPMTEYLNDEGYTYTGDKWSFWKKKDVVGKEIRVKFDYRATATTSTLFRGAMSTAHLNAITWNKAYCLFPYNTVIKKEAFLLEDLKETIASELNALSKEGIKTKTVSWDQGRIGFEPRNEHQSPDRLKRRRRIGDNHTWMLELNVEGVQPPDIPTAVLESTTFRLYTPWKWSQGFQVAIYRLDFDETISHPVLKYQYVTLAEDTLDEEDDVQFDEFDQRLRTSHYARRCAELSERLDEITLMELIKIPPADRPAQFAELSGTNVLARAHKTRGKFELPATWKFYDDEVIAFLDKIWKEQQEIDEQEELKRRAEKLDPTGEVQAK